MEELSSMAIQSCTMLVGNDYMFSQYVYACVVLIDYDNVCTTKES